MWCLLQHGFQLTRVTILFEFTVTDEDGDNIRCRWAKNSEECAGVCFGFVGATLDEVR